LPISIFIFLIFFGEYVILNERILFYQRGETMALKESGEMYLETIYVLNKKSDSVRSIDVCEYMGYSKPSVSRAVGLLKNNGFINVSKEGFLTLTKSGEETAKKLFERHTIISKFLMSLGVDEETATEDACRIEHVISDESFEAIKKGTRN
jgi:Mn-dependent DtxR family transcriptional regulator